MRDGFSMKSSRDLALDLAKKADHDLRMAEIGLADEAPLDTVAFHVQQTAGKMLKALLASRDIEYPRTHDVEALLDLAAPLCPELGILSTTPFASFAPFHGPRGGPESLPANTLSLECHTHLPRLHQVPGRRIEELDADRLSILPVTDDHTTWLLHGIHGGIVVKDQHEYVGLGIIANPHCALLSNTSPLYWSSTP